MPDGSVNIMKKQALVVSVVALLAGIPAGQGVAQERTSTVASTGFYGGVSLRDRGADTAGLGISAPTSVWSRYTPLLADTERASQLAFGGYRWGNDLALEASVARLDSYALRPAGETTPAGVGLALGPSDVLSKSWNVDVYGTWSLRRTLALYGRLGYGQSDLTPAYGGSTLSLPDARRTRDGVNYGIGLRYDMTPGFGLRLEYARFGRVPGDVSSSLMPESDRVQFGVQFRF